MRNFKTRKKLKKELSPSKWDYRKERRNNRRGDKYTLNEKLDLQITLRDRENAPNQRTQKKVKEKLALLL